MCIRDRYGLIAALPGKDTVTAKDRAAIEAARAAYNNLTEAQKKQVSNYSRLTDAEKALEDLGTTAIYEEYLRNVLEYVKLETSNPSLGSTYGEWAVLAEARGNVSASVWYDKYLSNMATTVASKNGKLDNTNTQTKHTEYSRVILALTAIGRDPSKVAGYNLLMPLGDFEKTIWQGMNGPIWALIALDSGNYDIPKNPAAKTQATRQLYIDEIVTNQKKRRWMVFDLSLIHISEPTRPY